MDSYFTELLARERIAELRRDAEHERLAAHAASRAGRRHHAKVRRLRLARQPRRATA
jgi:hypothetical protein